MKRPSIFFLFLLLAAGSVFAYNDFGHDLDTDLRLFIRDGRHLLVRRGSSGRRTPSPERSAASSENLSVSLAEASSGRGKPSSQRRGGVSGSGTPLVTASSGPRTPRSAFEVGPSPHDGATSSGSIVAGSSLPRSRSSLSQDMKEMSLQGRPSSGSPGEVSDGPSPPRSPFQQSLPESSLRGGSKFQQPLWRAAPLATSQTPLRPSPFSLAKQSALQRTGRETGSSGSLSTNASQSIGGISPPAMSMSKSNSVPAPRRPPPLTSPRAGWASISPKPELTGARVGQSRSPQDAEHATSFSGGPEFDVFKGRHWPSKDYDSDDGKKLIDDHVDAIIDLHRTPKPT